MTPAAAQKQTANGHAERRKGSAKALRQGGKMEVRKPEEWEAFSEIRKVTGTEDSSTVKNSEETEGRKEGFTMLKGGKGYTIADIEALPEGERAELIDGELFRMDTPTWTHQDILMQLSIEISLYIRRNHGKCRILPAPFAVYIKKDKYNYVEPDISVICDREKRSEKGCQGAPDWMIEIVSPSSRKMDYERKVTLYREAGAREYWIVDRETETVTVYDFTHDAETTLRPAQDTGSTEMAHKSEQHADERHSAHYPEPMRYTFSDRIKVGIFEDLWLNLSEMDLS